MTIITERDAVTIGDIPQPSASKQASWLRTSVAARRMRAKVVVCESALERVEADRYSRIMEAVIGGTVSSAGESGGNMKESAKALAKTLAMARRQRMLFFETRYGPMVEDVWCGRCSNASRLFYSVSKPGEFAYNAESGEWRCRDCAALEKLEEEQPHLRLQTVPIASMSTTTTPSPSRHFRPLARRTRPCLVVPLSELERVRRTAP